MAAEISPTMATINTFPITTTVSKTEVSQGWSYVRANPPRAMRDQTGGYRTGANAAPTMAVVTTTISTKRRITVSPPHGAAMGPSHGQLATNRPSDI